MEPSSPLRGSVFWPSAIIGGGVFVALAFATFGQPMALALGASVSFVVLAFASLVVGAGRAEGEPTTAHPALDEGDTGLPADALAGAEAGQAYALEPARATGEEPDNGGLDP